jgi:hypothetical protein
VPVRPTGATALATLFLVYGALTLLAVPVGLFRPGADMQVYDAVLAAMVGVYSRSLPVRSCGSSRRLPASHCLVGRLPSLCSI